MKAIKLDQMTVVYYPKGIRSFSEFMEFLNTNYNKFIPFRVLKDDECVDPYFVEEDTEIVLINISDIRCAKETEITVLSRKEYDARLSAIVDKVCTTCINFSDHSKPIPPSTYQNPKDPLDGHRGKISLDGLCWGFMSAADDIPC